MSKMTKSYKKKKSRWGGAAEVVPPVQSAGDTFVFLEIPIALCPWSCTFNMCKASVCQKKTNTSPLTRAFSLPLWSNC